MWIGDLSDSHSRSRECKCYLNRFGFLWKEDPLKGEWEDVWGSQAWDLEVWEGISRWISSALLGATTRWWGSVEVEVEWSEVNSFRARSELSPKYHTKHTIIPEIGEMGDRADLGISSAVNSLMNRIILSHSNPVLLCYKLLLPSFLPSLTIHLYTVIVNLWDSLLRAQATSVT